VILAEKESHMAVFLEVIEWFPEDFL